MTRQRLAAGLVAMVLTAALAGCGIPMEEEPRPLPTGTVSPSESPTFNTPPEASEDQVTLWFVREGGLIPEPRIAKGPVDSQGLIDMLVAGPTPEEKAVGVRSAVVSVVSGEPLVVTAQKAGVQVSGLPADHVAVVLEPEFKELLSEEQVLVLGQVVTTVAVDGISAVLFVDVDGQRPGVPLANGRLRNGPVTPEDYESLIP